MPDLLRATVIRVVDAYQSGFRLGDLPEAMESLELALEDRCCNVCGYRARHENLDEGRCFHCAVGAQPKGVRHEQAKNKRDRDNHRCGSP